MATVPLGPAVVDLTGVRAGDQNAVSMNITHPGGAAYDLTGKTVTAQARATSLATEHLDAVIDVVDAAQGKIVVRWPGDAVTAILAGKDTWKGVWDLQIQVPGEDALTLLAGNFAAVMDVTRTP